MPLSHARSDAPVPDAPIPDAPVPVLAAFATGFALSGFFDGILLHQILQWHHLLSAFDTDLRFQVIADGWFHMVMYAVALAGLVGLWRGRRGSEGEAAGRLLVAWALIGFGAWHVADAVLSHWLLGIHRIRMDSTMPLAWDLGWLAVFGIGPVLAGLRMRAGDGDGAGGLRAAALALACLGAGGWSALSTLDRPYATVVFADAVTPAHARALTAAAEARIAWADEGAGVFVLTGLRPGAALRLYREGALFVGGAGLPEGCFGRTEI